MNNPNENTPLCFPYNFDEYIEDEDDREDCGHDEAIDFELSDY
jgi:hypothetical protein